MDHAAAGADGAAAADHRRCGFARHERVVDRALVIDQLRIGGHDLLRANHHDLAGAELVDGYEPDRVVPFHAHGERKKRSNGSIECDAVESLLLEEPADQEEEHQTRKAEDGEQVAGIRSGRPMEVPLTMQGQPVSVRAATDGVAAVPGAWAESEEEMVVKETQGENC